MIVRETTIPEVKLIEPKVYGDDRGFFVEVFQADRYAAHGITGPFIQDNHSGSRGGVLRGLHYQIRHPQGKLVRVVAGAIFDVAVDLRRSSPSFGQWVGAMLSAENRHQLWVPPGFGHGFLVCSAWAEVEYKVTDVYAPDWDRTVRWDDPAIGIDWPIEAGSELTLSDKDRAGSLLEDAEVFP